MNKTDKQQQGNSDPYEIQDQQGASTVHRANHRLCKKHRPNNSGRKVFATYWFLNACRDGCLPCVRILVEECGVQKDVRSESGKFNGHAFVKYSAETGVIDEDAATMLFNYLANMS